MFPKNSTFAAHLSLEKAKSQIFLKKLISCMAFELCWVKHVPCLLFKRKYIDIKEKLYSCKYEFY